MAIQIGDKIPTVLIKQLTPSGIQDISTQKIFDKKKIVMFAVPGAFTPTCSAKHLPGYLQAAETFKSLGIEIACLAVNDPFVMHAWLREGNALDVVTPLADGNGTFTKALGLDMDGGAYGLGLRAQRFALYAEDGVVKVLAVEKPGAFEVSGAEPVLTQIKKLV